MLGPLFSAVEVARERLTSMLDAAKIRVCSVVHTDVADCLLVAILPTPPIGVTSCSRLLCFHQPLPTIPMARPTIRSKDFQIPPGKAPPTVFHRATMCPWAHRSHAKSS